MQHVDVRHLGERRRQPVQREARLDQRQVERLAVVGDHRARVGRHVGNRFEQRRSAVKLERKNCRIRNVPPANQPQPTRNAYVPAPPARPVVSRSMKSRLARRTQRHWPAATTAARRRRTAAGRRPAPSSHGDSRARTCDRRRGTAGRCARAIGRRARRRRCRRRPGLARSGTGASIEDPPRGALSPPPMTPRRRSDSVVMR